MGGREPFQYTELFFWLWQVLMHIHTVFHQQKWWPTPVSWVLDGEQCPANGIVAFSSRVQSHEESWILGRVSCGMWQWDAGCCISLLILWLMAAFRGILRGPVKKHKSKREYLPQRLKWISSALKPKWGLARDCRCCMGLWWCCRRFCQKSHPELTLAISERQVVWDTCLALGLPSSVHLLDLKFTLLWERWSFLNDFQKSGGFISKIDWRC